MTVDEMKELFEKYADEYQYGDFEKILGTLSTRPDMHAFRLIENLLPNKKFDMIASAEHDQIWLGVDPEELAAVATPEIIRQLVACHIFFDDQYDGLGMWV